MPKFSGKTEAATCAITTSKYEKNYNSVLYDLLIVAAFTVVNIVLMLINADSYFLFSAYVPYALVTIGMFNTGSFPAEYYDDTWEYEFLDKSFLIEMVIAAAVVLALYLVCWYFARKKKLGGLIAATVLFTVDTILMLTLNGISADMLLDIVLHIVIEVTLIYGIVCFKKMKKEKAEAEEAAMYEEAYAVSQDAAYQDIGSGFDSSTEVPEETSTDTFDGDNAEIH